MADPPFSQSESAAPRSPNDNAFALYMGLRQYEEHFNSSQAEAKKLASAWMLVTFSAIAFIIRGDLSPDKSLIDSVHLLVAVGIGGNVGLLTLWVIDQRVYQQLLNAVFEVGLELERRHEDWPPIRSLMWVNSGARGMARYHALFYAAPMALNGAAAVYALLSTRSTGHFALLAGSLVALVPLLFVVGDWFRSLGLERHFRERSRSIEDVAQRWRQ